MQAIDLGFDADRLAVAEVLLPSNDYPSREERLAFVEEAIAGLGRTPGVSDALAVTWLPLNHESNSAQIAPPSMAGVTASEWPLAIQNYSNPGYFETMGIELIEGRDFGSVDAADAPPVAIVSRALVSRFWPKQSPIGQALLAGDPAEPETLTIVGVVANIRHSDLNMGEPGPQLYRPATQASARRFFLVARTEQEPGAIVGGVRATLQAVNPNLSYPVRPMTAVVQENLLQ